MHLVIPALMEAKGDASRRLGLADRGQIGPIGDFLFLCSDVG